MIRRNILVVDDYEIWGRGFADLLTHLMPPDATATWMDHDTALGLGTRDLNTCRTIVVDVTDGTRADDAYVGALVAEHVKLVDPKVIVVAFSDRYDLDAARIRMAKAGADYLFSRQEFQERDLAAELVKSPESFSRSRLTLQASDFAAAQEIGIDLDQQDSHLNRLVRWFHTNSDELDSQLTRKETAELREDFDRIAGPVQPTIKTGVTPFYQQDRPSIAQIRRIREQLLWLPKRKK